MPRERTQTMGWLPSSTQLFATVLIVSVLAVGLSTAATPKQPVGVASLHQPTAIIAVGRLLQCQQVPQLTVQQLQATAAAVSAGQALNGALQRQTAVGLVEVGCSMHLPPAGSSLVPSEATWQPGPVHEQHLHVSGVDSLDCLMQSRMSADSRTPYIWLLRSLGTPDVLEVVEYAQLPAGDAAQHNSLDAAALLQAWLGTAVPDSCKAILITVAGQDSAHAMSGTQPDSTGTDGQQQGLITNSKRSVMKKAARFRAHTRALHQAEVTAVTNNGSAATEDISSATPSPQLDQQVVDFSPAPPAEDPDNVQAPTQAAAAGSPTSPSPSTADGSSLNSSVEAPPASPNPRAASRGSSNDTVETVIAQDQLLPGVVNSTLSTNTSMANASMSIANLRSLCSLQPETSPCRAALPRWAFDVGVGACTQFTYGGCDGNSNNFMTQTECEDACSAVMLAVKAPGPPVEPPAVIPEGPVATTIEDPRVLAGSGAPPTSSKAQNVNVNKLFRVAAAGVVAGLTILLL